jgi:hypothetical protein
LRERKHRRGIHRAGTYDGVDATPGGDDGESDAGGHGPAVSRAEHVAPRHAALLLAHRLNLRHLGVGGGLAAADAHQHGARHVAPAAADEEARRLGNEDEAEHLQTRRHDRQEDHEPPVAGVVQRVADAERHEDADGDAQLVRHHEAAAVHGRRQLCDEHGRDCRSDADGGADDDAADDEQRHVARQERGEDAADDEEHAADEDGETAADAVGGDASQERADDSAEQED